MNSNSLIVYVHPSGWSNLTLHVSQVSKCDVFHVVLEDVIYGMAIESSKNLILV